MQHVALKEWAVAIKALRDGKQIMIMRKGGIAEETRDFTLESRSFFFYPGYEHQKKELIKQDFYPDLDHSLQEFAGVQPNVLITCRAEATEDLEIFEQNELDQLRGYHIWTDRFAEERLKWKKKNPLHLLLLRVYKLERPVSIPVLPQYSGCKSWIELDAELKALPAVPVLGDEQFFQRVAQIKRQLGRE